MTIHSATQSADPSGAASKERAAMVSERLRDLLAREESFHFTPDLGDDASLVDAGAIDSFGMIALVIRIEEAFGVTVTPEEATADRFRSVSSIAAYIESKLDGHHRG